MLFMVLMLSAHIAAASRPADGDHCQEPSKRVPQACRVKEVKRCWGSWLVLYVWREEHKVVGACLAIVRVVVLCMGCLISGWGM